MNDEHAIPLTPVERHALGASPFGALYPPTEKMPAIVVESWPALGTLAAMRFIEWVQANPGGVVSLPTGRTPEHFIKSVERVLKGWDEAGTRRELEAWGIDPARRPDLAGLHFVQIDEFYPIKPGHRNSFYHYVCRYYLEGFGLDPGKALLIDGSRIGLADGQTLDSVWPDHEVDLGLRCRGAKGRLEAVQKDALARIDQWCQEYEERIRTLGGIGFFLGGIGPDGHVGFNVRGSDHHSTTRLTETNYETQAAAATDLGGVEIARRRLVITIGLGTITFNPRCTAVIIAAGDAKAKVVADAVQNDRDVLYPATALHALPNARFYLTRGAARMLTERRVVSLAGPGGVSDEEAERTVIDLAVRAGKRVEGLTDEDFAGDRFASAALRGRPETREQLVGKVRDDLARRIERGSRVLAGTRFLHTEPHHDDIMLGYLPAVVRHVREASNTHHFASLTSGFTSVTNGFMRAQIECLKRFAGTPECAALMDEGYFDPGDAIARNRDVWQYLDGVAAASEAMASEGIARRLLRDLTEVFGEGGLDDLKGRADELARYFATQYPGSRDPAHVQRLKGMRREWEAECLWGYFGWNCSNILHLRLGFYTGDVFLEEPTVERDVQPVLDVLERVKPDVVTVALDPEGSGPDTHYKVLQAITEALRRYERASGRSDITVWGYRNVWQRFHPCEANVYVPISLNMFAIMQSAFENAFASQRDASFPSYEHDGPFSELSQRVQVEQYQALKTCLGRRWFNESESALIRATRGLVFLRQMTLAELYERSRELERAACTARA